ncbi:MarR family winged helix-turn-helix transcriptional regulator [Bradyrhizobium sp. McL0615]|uniref:MarR family winged helix-turn-helix transcriptional regulator n=1 Tax=Bradyrhizobium sp. McL0615 TaxID=3415673 RepID=UPI003CED1F47
MKKPNKMPKPLPLVSLRAEAIEGFLLHFFANVNLAADALEAMEPHGLAKTHNRILSFVAFSPGVTVGEMVSALRVSHQNLNGPMRLLQKSGLLIAKIGNEDRRQRQLFVSAKGRRLVEQALARQMTRVEAAYRECGPDAVAGFLKVQRHLVEQQDRDWVERLKLDPAEVTRA